MKKQDIIKDIIDRGVINNITNTTKLEEALKNKKAVYIGFDPSFKSLHLGNYVQVQLLKYFNKNGIKAYAVIGGATGLIGDPSGKKSERVLLDLDIINNNIVCLTKQLKSLAGVEVINNYDWYKNMTLFEFLRVAGKLINVNYMLEKDIIKNRLTDGISYAEFSYNLIQGYDFLHLYQTKNVAIQIGGSDQWGNITTGLEMIRKVVGDSASAAGMTINLLTKSDGSKFGKSEKGAIYLDPAITTPFEMYQFLINQADDDIRKLFMFFSDLSIKEVDDIIIKHNENKQNRYGQKILAKEIISKIHGLDSFNLCTKLADALFYDKLDTLTANELEICLKQFDTKDLNSNDQVALADFAIENKIVGSKRIFRELIEQKAFSINGKNLTNDDVNLVLNSKNSIANKFTVIKKGKKNYFIIRWNKK